MLIGNSEQPYKNKLKDWGIANNVSHGMINDVR